MDLRSYRPVCVQEFFEDLQQETMGDKSVRKRLEAVGDYSNMAYLLGVVDQVHAFRNGHWQFVLHYIMKNTRYARATGGTPITTWLPNQLGAVLECEKALVDEIAPHEEAGELSNDAAEVFRTIRDKLQSKIELLERQINELCNSDYNVDEVIKPNEELGLEDNPSSK